MSKANHWIRVRDAAIAGFLATSVCIASAQVNNPGVQQSGAVVAGNCAKWGPGIGQISDAGAVCGSGGSITPANPTAVAGPTAINGASPNYMRSDAAPAVQQGSSSQKGIVQVDGVSITAVGGVISAAASATGANPSATAGPAAINGSSPNFMRSDAAPAVQLATTGQKGLVQPDGTTIGVTAGVISTINRMGFINVKDAPYNAQCDGVTDDTTAINAADAAAASAGKALYFPAGTCMAQGLNPKRNNLVWFGDGKYLSCIKAVNPGIGFDTLVWFGERTLTTTYQSNTVMDMCFIGNGVNSNAVVERRNQQNFLFKNIFITGGASHGFKSETSGTTINTQLLRNQDLNVESSVNVGKGFYFNGEKDQQFTGLSAHNNNGDGIYWGPANLNSSALCETTEGYGAVVSARDNGGDGIVFDEVEKYAIASIQSDINAGYGIRFLSTLTGCTSTGSNSVNIANVVIRNNALGGIRASDSSFVYGAVFGNVWYRGDNSTVGAFALRFDGANSLQFGNVSVEANPGTAVLIQQGTPLGVTTQSGNIQFGSMRLINNGNAGASTNHGISILNSTANVQIASLISSNLQTTGSNFELNVAATVTQAKIGKATLNAAAGGNELNAAGADLTIINRETGTRNYAFGPGPTRFTPGGSAPALSGCGTTPAISGTDTAGEVTMGTGSPTGCTITFNLAYLNTPYCVVTWRANLASMSYTNSTTAITLTQTATSSNKVNYLCMGASGG